MSCITGRRAAYEHRDAQTHRQGAVREPLAHWRRRALGLVSIAGRRRCGKTGFNVGSLTWLTTIIAIGVMLALYGIMNERKEHALQFVLSLPLSHRRLRARQDAGTAAVLSRGVADARAPRPLVLIFAQRTLPDGVAPYAVLLCVFMLANFAVVLCGALHLRSPRR